MKSLSYLWIKIVPVIYDITMISLKMFGQERDETEEYSKGDIWTFSSGLVRILLRDLGRSCWHRATGEEHPPYVGRAMKEREKF